MYKQILYKSLVNSGFEIISSHAPINSIKSYSKENTFAVAKMLYENGILVTPFIEPSVPVNQGRVRLIAGANLSQDTIKEASAIINKVGCA